MARIISLPSTSAASFLSPPAIVKSSSVSGTAAMATVFRPTMKTASTLLSHLRRQCSFTPHPYWNPASSYFYSVKASLGSNAESTDGPKSVNVQVAYELLQNGHRYLDVRTVEEFRSGHVPGATNVPFLIKVGPGMTKNSEFLNEVSQQFNKDEQILVGCQMGKRSLMATNDLQAAGYTGIVDVSGGYLAWKENGLPTEP